MFGKTFGVISIFALLCFTFIARPANADQARDDAFSGKWACNRLQVDISQSGASYTGTIQKGEQKFAFVGQVDQFTQLVGTFSVGETKFPFTASLSQDRMLLNSGGANYLLTRVEINPLLRRAAIQSGNIEGKWAITGDLGGETFSLTLGAKGEMTVESSNGSSSSGPTYAYANNIVTFDGSMQMNKLSLGGTWKIQWKSADEFTTTDDKGMTLALKRMGA